MLHSGGSGSRSAIISSRDDAAPIIAIEDTWPQLAGKQTSATAAAGKVIYGDSCLACVTRSVCIVVFAVHLGLLNMVVFDAEI